MTLSSFFTFTVDLETNMRERDMNRQEHTLVKKGEHVKIVVSTQCEDVCLNFSFYVFCEVSKTFFGNPLQRHVARAYISERLRLFLKDLVNIRTAVEWEHFRLLTKPGQLQLTFPS